jgi:hypothetical protein
MTRKEFILTLSKRYIIPILFFVILFKIGKSFYYERNKLEVIQGILEFSGFIIIAILIIGSIRLLFDKYKFLNYVFYGIIIAYLGYLIVNQRFDFEKDILIIAFSILIEAYKLVIKKLDKTTTNI